LSASFWGTKGGHRKSTERHFTSAKKIGLFKAGATKEQKGEKQVGNAMLERKPGLALTLWGLRLESLISRRGSAQEKTQPFVIAGGREAGKKGSKIPHGKPKAPEGSCPWKGILHDDRIQERKQGR